MINKVTKDTPPDLTNNFLPTKRGFEMASLNITSLTKHFDELRIMLANYPLDVISINEPTVIHRYFIYIRWNVSYHCVSCE